MILQFSLHLSFNPKVPDDVSADLRSLFRLVRILHFIVVFERMSNFFILTNNLIFFISIGTEKENVVVDNLDGS